MRVEELKKLRVLANEIKSKYEVLEEAKATAYRITKIVSDMPKAKNSGDGFNTAVIKTLIMVEELQGTIKHMIEEFGNLYEEASKEINKLEDIQERTVLEYRYLAYKPWHEIAGLMHYTKRRVQQIHDVAIKHFI